jgi:hypothetical protein
MKKFSTVTPFLVVVLFWSCQSHLSYHLYVVNFIVIFFLVKNTGSPLVGIHISKFAILLLNFRGQTK